MRYLKTLEDSHCGYSRGFFSLKKLQHQEEENIQNQPISQVNWGSDGFQDKGARNFELILKIQDQNKKF